MAAPVLGLYEDDDSTSLGTLTFSQAPPGTATAAQAAHLWNDKGGGASSDDATNMRLKASVRNPGESDYQADGREFVERFYIQARITGGNGITVNNTDWIGLGAGSYLELPTLPSDTAVHLEFRVYGDADTEITNVEVAIDLSDWYALPLGEGFFESGCNGVMSGVGDSLDSHFVVAGDCTESGTPDDDVVVPDLRWVYEGIPYVELEQDIELDQIDGDTNSLSSGEEYIAVLTCGTTVNTTKGSKAAIGTAEPPTAPTGEPVLCWVTIDYQAGGYSVIHNADISNDWILGEFRASHAALVATIGRGTAIVDNNKIVNQNTSQVTYTASSTNYLWLQRDGSFAKNTTGIVPSQRAYLLEVATTDGSGVTASQRTSEPPPNRLHTLYFHYDAVIAADQELVLPYPLYRYAYIRRVEFVLEDFGTDDFTSGDWIVDILRSRDAGTFTTIFTSSGTDDERPTIAYDATLPRASAELMEVLDVLPYDVFKAKITSVPSGGTTQPSGATVALIVELT